MLHSRKQREYGTVASTAASQQKQGEKVEKYGRKGILIFLRSRAPFTAAITLLVSIVIAVAVGTIIVPAAFRNGAPTGAPLWAYLPILPASVLYMTLYAATAQSDRIAAQDIKKWNALHYCLSIVFGATLAIALSMLISWLISLFSLEASLSSQASFLLGLATMRNMLAWSGIVALGGLLWGHTRAWLLPFFTIFLLEWFGRDAYGLSYWWAFPDVPVGNIASWGLALGLFILGWVCVKRGETRRML